MGTNRRIVHLKWSTSMLLYKYVQYCQQNVIVHLRYSLFQTKLMDMAYTSVWVHRLMHTHPLGVTLFVWYLCIAKVKKQSSIWMIGIEHLYSYFYNLMSKIGLANTPHKLNVFLSKRTSKIILFVSIYFSVIHFNKEDDVNVL